MLPIKIINLMK